MKSSNKSSETAKEKVDFSPYYEEQTSLFFENYKNVLSKIPYDSKLLKEFLRGATNYHMGYCSVKPSGDYFVIDDSDFVVNGTKTIPFTRYDDSKDNEFHWLCYQRSGPAGDDYTGYSLIPLSDGTYWCLYYEC